MRKYLLFLILSVLLGLSGCTSGLSTEQESGEVVSASEETTEKEGFTEEVSTEEPSETEEKEIYSNGEIEFALPEERKDNQIYKQKSTDSKCITLKAQNVYFLESDRDLWMKVK